LQGYDTVRLHAARTYYRTRLTRKLKEKCTQGRNFKTKSGGDMGRDIQGPQGRQRGWDSWGGATRSLQAPWERHKLPGVVRAGSPTQIDSYALLGLEMVTDGDNSH